MQCWTKIFDYLARALQSYYVGVKGLKPPPDTLATISCSSLVSQAMPFNSLTCIIYFFCFHKCLVCNYFLCKKKKMQRNKSTVVLIFINGNNWCVSVMQYIKNWTEDILELMSLILRPWLSTNRIDSYEEHGWKKKIEKLNLAPTCRTANFFQNW